MNMGFFKNFGMVLLVALSMLILATSVFALSFRTVYNPFTGKLDYYSENTALDNVTIGNMTADVITVTSCVGCAGGSSQGDKWQVGNGLLSPNASSSDLNVTSITIGSRKFNVSSDGKVNVSNLTMPAFTNCASIETDGTGNFFCSNSTGILNNALIKNDSALFANQTYILSNLSKNLESIQTLNGTMNGSSSTDELDDTHLSSALSNFGSQNGNFTAPSNASSFNISGGNSVLTSIVNGILTISLKAVNSAITSFTSLIYFDTGISAPLINATNITMVNGSAKQMHINETVHFVGTAKPSTPEENSLKMYAEITQGHTRPVVMDDDGIEFVIDRDNVFIGRNMEGVTINKSQPVYINGSTGNVPNLRLAQANGTVSLPAVGIAVENINNGAFGNIMILGILTQVDTSAFAVGDRLFVSPSSAGALTNARPVYPNFTQRIGSVLISGIGNGAIYVTTAPFIGGEESGTNAGNFVVSNVVGNLSGNATNVSCSGITGTADNVCVDADTVYGDSGLVKNDSSLFSNQTLILANLSQLRNNITAMNGSSTTDELYGDAGLTANDTTIFSDLGQLNDTRLMNNSDAKLNKLTVLSTLDMIDNNGTVKFSPDNRLLSIEYNGTANAVQIVSDGSGTSNNALSLLSKNGEDTTLGVTGNQTSRGTIKVTHDEGIGGDSSASAISVLLNGLTTAARGLFIDIRNSTGSGLTITNNTHTLFDSDELGKVTVNSDQSSCALWQNNAGDDQFRVDCSSSLTWLRKLIPVATGIYDLGDSTHIWRTLYTTNINVTQLNATSMNGVDSRFKYIHVDQLNTTNITINTNFNGTLIDVTHGGNGTILKFSNGTSQTVSIDNQGNANFSTLNASQLYGLVTNATFAASTGNITYSSSAGNATFAASTSNITYSSNAGNATFSRSAGNSTYSNLAGNTYTVSGSVIGSNTVSNGATFTGTPHLKGNLSVHDASTTDAVNISVINGYWCIGC